VDDDRQALLGVPGDLALRGRESVDELRPDLSGPALADESNYLPPAGGLARHEDAPQLDLDERAVHVGARSAGNLAVDSRHRRGDLDLVPRGPPQLHQA
jgi:hypothetical protein